MAELVLRACRRRAPPALPSSPASSVIRLVSIALRVNKRQHSVTSHFSLQVLSNYIGLGCVTAAAV